MVCPICKKPVKELDDPNSPNKYFPFCSERCKLIDLGRWLGGRYQIPVRPDEDEVDSPAPRSPDDEA
jgi:endogenous inhibitor of DNA gyrase (YacG/DUF329 family)